MCMRGITSVLEYHEKPTGRAPAEALFQSPERFLVISPAVANRSLLTCMMSTYRKTGQFANAYAFTRTVSPTPSRLHSRLATAQFRQGPTGPDVDPTVLLWIDPNDERGEIAVVGMTALATIFRMSG